MSNQEQKSRCKIFLQNGYFMFNCKYDAETGACIKCGRKLGENQDSSVLLLTERIEKMWNEYTSVLSSSQTDWFGIEWVNNGHVKKFITKVAIPLIQQEARKEAIEECVRTIEKYYPEIGKIDLDSVILQKLIK